MNTFGINLRLTTFGESHGPAIGGVLDGMPSRVHIDYDEIMTEMRARRPGSEGTSQRKEEDIPEILSGISPEGLTLGTPIGFIIRNRDARSSDYEELKYKYRPNHADYTYEMRYGIRDARGGGRSSARETASRVVAGAIAGQWLKTKEISIYAGLCEVGNRTVMNIENLSTADLSSLLASGYPVIKISEIIERHRPALIAEAERIRAEGDSVGGKVLCCISGLRSGVGNPVYAKLHARLAEGMMSINAAKSFEYGLSGVSSMRGSRVADIMTSSRWIGNTSGGIQGGISNGQTIYFTVGFKPTPSIPGEFHTVNSSMEDCIINIRGRHDPCVAIRAVPVVKAMASLVVADELLFTEHC